MNILVVDDHPMTVAGYIESISKSVLMNPSISFTKAFDIETAFLAIERVTTETSFDLLLLDQGLPPYKEAGILSGSDLALHIRSKLPACRIVMITAHTEVIVVYDILKKIRPDGLLIKNDITPENLPSAILEVINGTTFQSISVKNIVKEIWKKELMIDDVNRQILFYLSKGYKIKDLEGIVSLSISPIQRRIAQMKDVFDVKEDSSLVKEAILQGFL